VDLVGAACTVLAALTLSLALLHRGDRLSPHAWLQRQAIAATSQLAGARLETSPHRYLAIKFSGPLLGAAIGWLVSPVCALIGLTLGFGAPRLYVRWLLHAQAERSEAQAPQLLQTLIAQLGAGATYLEALRQARQRATDAWIRSDLETVLARFLLNEPLEVALSEVRPRIQGRNLGLVLDTLALCCATRMPAHGARQLLQEISSTVQFNVGLQQEVRARVSGQRLQVWLLALLVPGMFLYFRLVAPDLLNTLDTTALGRFVLLPAAALLECLGLYLSFQVTRLRS
jgi:Flp pilus assembly protein TadB